MQQTLVQVVLPEMGESVTEGSVTSWRKKPGDFVQAGEALVDVTTDKVDVEVPSPAAGKITRVLVEEGKTIRVGAPLAEIDTAASADGKAQAVKTNVAPAPSTTAQAAPPSSVPPQPAPQDAQGDGSAQPVKASPLARRLAAVRGVDLARVEPARPGDPIRRADVVRSIEESQAKRAPAEKAPVESAPPKTVAPGYVPAAPAKDEKATPLRGAAASLADHMERSLAIPTATSFRTLGVAMLDTKRRQLNDALTQADFVSDAAQKRDAGLRQRDVDRHRELLPDRAGRQRRGGAAVARVALDDREIHGKPSGA